ncbi:MAG: YbaK/EbsC family protein [Bryobacteraceae bacterium]|jgi:prolyl-tRNA synthetase
MQWSKLFIPTLRENPAEAETVSDRFLARAGYVRRGYLFLGNRALRKIAQVVREEMEAIGAQEVSLPDEDAVATVARELRSYRQLPQIWYQIRGQQMDCWSFDSDVRPACERIFTHCQLPFVALEAGEFVIESDAGEGCMVQCPSCGYAATRDNAAATPSAPVESDPEGDLTPEEFHTPGRKTIADVADFTGQPETTQMKSLVLVAAGRPVLALVRGDHQLSEAKLAAALGVVSARPAQPEEIRAWFGAGAGSLGPVGVTNMRVIADETLRGRRNMIAGANRDDYHLRHVTPGEDFQPEYFDLRRVEEGDSCRHCGAALAFRQAFEIGYVRGSTSMGLHVTNEASEEVPIVVGSCGIDIERMLRAAIELWHDKDGIVLPAAMAPFEVVITPVNVQDAGQREAAESLHAECARIGLDALYDDRDERPGVKFKDADLIGVPWRITVGRKLSQGMVEVVDRRAKTSHDKAVTEAARFVKNEVQ